MAQALMRQCSSSLPAPPSPQTPRPPTPSPPPPSPQAASDLQVAVDVVVEGQLPGGHRRQVLLHLAQLALEPPQRLQLGRHVRRERADGGVLVCVRGGRGTPSDRAALASTRVSSEPAHSFRRPLCKVPVLPLHDALLRHVQHGRFRAGCPRAQTKSPCQAGPCPAARQCAIMEPPKPLLAQDAPTETRVCTRSSPSRPGEPPARLLPAP